MGRVKFPHILTAGVSLRQFRDGEVRHLALSNSGYSVKTRKIRTMMIDSQPVMM